MVVLVETNSMAIPGLIIYQGNPSISPKRSSPMTSFLTGLVPLRRSPVAGFRLRKEALRRPVWLQGDGFGGGPKGPKWGSRRRPHILELSQWVCHQGSSKDTFCSFETWAFSTKIKGNHHLQGNVQLYNVRIPVCLHPQTNPAVSLAIDFSQRPPRKCPRK